MAKNSFILFAATYLLLQVTLADKITCPRFICRNPDLEGPIRQDMCYQHDKKQPVEEIITHPCNWYMLYDKT